jgi:hypothetical protein
MRVHLGHDARQPGVALELQGQSWCQREVVDDAEGLEGAVDDVRRRSRVLGLTGVAARTKRDKSQQEGEDGDGSETSHGILLDECAANVPIEIRGVISSRGGDGAPRAGSDVDAKISQTGQRGDGDQDVGVAASIGLSVTCGSTTGTPSLQTPMKRCCGVLPRAVSQS